MDPKYAGETLRHLEKELELLTEAYNSMSHELSTLQKAANGVDDQQEGVERGLVIATNTKQ